MGLPEEAEMEQILSDLQALKRLYMLLHKGPADENVTIFSWLRCCVLSLVRSKKSQR